MRNYIIDALAKIGVWCCQKSIHMANSGHIDFEVIVPQKQPIIIYYKKEPKKKKMPILLMTLAICIATILGVWAVLTLSASIERSSDKITQELKREHDEEIEKFVFRKL